MGLYLVYLVNIAITAAAAAAVFAYWVATRKRIAAETVGRADEQAARILKDAERDAEARKKEALLEAKEKAHELRTEAERAARERSQQLSETEQQLSRREATLADRGVDGRPQGPDLQARAQAVAEREKATAAAAEKYEQLVAAQQHELERVSGLTTDEAKDLLLKHIEADARRDAANLVKRLDAEAREQAAAKARQYITEAIQRSAAEHTIETTVSVVDLPSDDLKGRIIGREGRNIRALEQATGVDLIVDDTPGAIILSGFDPYRREIAKQSIERLIADGRIHPARIEEVVEKVKAEMEESVRKDGEAAAFELGMHDLHPELQKLMGRLKYRTSYGQNVLNHSKEVAYLAGIMAREVGLNATVAIRAAFLHDCGKAINRELEGTHLESGHRPAPQARRERSGGHGHGRAPHGHRLAVARSDDRAGGRRDFRGSSRRAPRHPRVLRQAPREARGDCRFLQGRLEGVRAAGGPRDPHHGRERAHLRRRSGVAVEGHRAPHRERARVPGSHQGDGHPGNSRGGLRQVTVGELGEHALIERIRGRLPAAPSFVLVGLGDDAAVLEPERNALEVITTDSQVEGVHFDRRFSDAADIGHKALAVNLSDLAAMGAAPRAALLSLVLPPAWPVAQVDALLDGLLALADRARIAVVGGNIARSPGPLVVDVTVTGSVHRRRVLTRAGARAGDELYVTGALGGSAVGLKALRANSGGNGPRRRSLSTAGAAS